MNVSWTISAHTTWAWHGFTVALALVLVGGLLYLRGQLVAPLSAPSPAEAGGRTHGDGGAAAAGPAAGWRHAAVCLALALLLLAFLSPVNLLARRYFFVHVLQQLLLVAWIPGLFLAADPLPALWRGLPLGGRTALAAAVRAGQARWSGWAWLLGPGPAYLGFACVYWLWHDPALHRAMLSSDALWYLEKGSLLLAALLYWRHITAAQPRIGSPLPPLLRAGYALLGAWPIKLTGIVLLFGGAGVYTYPGQLHLIGLDINANSLGSMLVWVVGGIFYTTTATILLRRWLAQEDGKPALPLSAWATRERMRAPGWR